MVNNGGCHSFCRDIVSLIRKKRLSNSPSVPAAYQTLGSNQIINQKSAIVNPTGQSEHLPPLPQKGEKKQKKRSKIKTANGVQ
jgi:hypothetical protein